MLRAFTTQQGNIDIAAQYQQRTLEIEDRRLKAGNTKVGCFSAMLQLSNERTLTAADHASHAPSGFILCRFATSVLLLANYAVLVTSQTALAA